LPLWNGPTSAMHREPVGMPSLSPIIASPEFRDRPKRRVRHAIVSGEWGHWQEPILTDMRHDGAASRCGLLRPEDDPVRPCCGRREAHGLHPSIGVQERRRSNFERKRQSPGTAGASRNL
jgi:hypothetical protein